MPDVDLYAVQLTNRRGQCWVTVFDNQKDTIDYANNMRARYEKRFAIAMWSLTDQPIFRPWVFKK